MAIAIDPKTGEKIFVKLVELYTAREVARLWKISPKTMYAMARGGLIRHVRIQRNVRFIESDILAWLEARICAQIRGKGKK